MYLLASKILKKNNRTKKKINPNKPEEYRIFKCHNEKT